MVNKNDTRKRRKGGPKGFQKRHCRNNINRSSSSVSSSTTGEENVVIIPATVIPTTSVIKDTSSVVESASSKKLKSVDPVVIDCTLTSENPFHYMIIDSEVLQTILNVVGKCPKCQKNELVFSNKVSQRRKNVYDYASLTK